DELSIDPLPVYKNSEGKYPNTQHYWFRVTANFSQGESAMSEAATPYIPVGNIVANEPIVTTTNINPTTGSIELKWKGMMGATGYRIWIFNGKDYESFDVGGQAREWNSKDKNIWPTNEEIANGRYLLHKDGKGTNLAVDPSPVYKNSGGKYPDKKNYWVRMSALYPQGESKLTVPQTPDITTQSMLGLNKYDTYNTHMIGDGIASVNVVNQNVVGTFTDLSMYTRGNINYVFKRTYNAQSTSSSVLGKGWTFSGNEKIEEQLQQGTSKSNLLYTADDGSRHVFMYEESIKEWHSISLPYVKIKQIGTTYEMSNPDQRKWIFERPTSNEKQYNLTHTTDIYSNLIRYTYDTKQRLVSVTEQDRQGENIGRPVRFEYDDVTNLLKKVRYEGRTLSFKYSDGHLIETTLTDGKDSVTHTYNDQNSAWIVTDSKGEVIKFDYDETSLQVTRNNKDEAHYEKVETLRTRVTEDGKVTSYLYTFENGRYLVSEVESSEGRTTYAYDSKFNLSSQCTYPISKTANNDEEDLRSEEKAPETITYRYDNKGNLLSQTTNYLLEDGSLTTHNISLTYHPETNFLVTEKDEDGTTTSYEYDGLMKRTTKLSNNKETIEIFDEYGRTREIIDVNGNIQKLDYDDRETGNTSHSVTITQSYKVPVIYTYDWHENLSKVTDGKGTTTSYTYDLFENITELTDGLGRKKIYADYKNNQPKSVRYPGMHFTYDYDDDGSITRETTPSGNVFTHAYSNGRFEDSKLNSHTLLVDYEYNEKELVNLINYKTNSYIKTFGYDSFDRVDKYTVNGLGITYKYVSNKDVVDSMETTINDWFVKFDYKDVNSEKKSDLQIVTYDENIKSADKQKEKPLFASTFERREELNSDILEVKNIVDNLRQETNLYKKTTNYEKGRHHSISYDHGKLFSYTYYPNGNIKTETSPWGMKKFEYDENSQLKIETLEDGTTVHYTYDEVGNRKTRTIEKKDQIQTDIFEAYTDDNQVTKKNGFSYIYDADGNLTSDERFNYVFDEEGNLVSVKETDNRVIAKYSYDEVGLRTQKKVGNKTHDYYYVADILQTEVIKQNNVVIETKHYQWDGSGTQPIAVIVKKPNEAANVYHYITNYRGDVTEIITNDKTTVATYQYDAYGNITSQTGDFADSNPIRYAGYYYDSELEMYYLKARFYHPENGSFISLDPYPGDADEPISQNGYTYVSNNPIIYFDPNGEKQLNQNHASFSGPMPSGGGFGRPNVKPVSGKNTGFGNLAYGSKYGIRPYSQLKKTTKGTKLEAHHIIEQRLAKRLGISNKNSMLSVAVIKAEHQIFTNAWRKEIPYGTNYEELSKNRIWEAAKNVYKKYPELKEAARKTIFK
ncbi:MAG: RHS repeat-associated core domain-containing protein, partial [Bacilli bacterium]